MSATNENETELTQASLSDSSWTAPLLFPCQMRICAGQMLYPDGFTEQELNAHIESRLYGRSVRLYFDPKSYPPPIGQGIKKLSDENHAIFEVLRRDLQVAALKTGQSLTCNGSSGRNVPNKVFNCFRSRTHICNSVKRRRTTNKPSERDRVCHYRFTVQWDDTGYYLSLGSGCASHLHHDKLDADSIAKRLTRQQEQDEDDSVADFPYLSNSDDESGTFFDAVNPSFEACCRALEHNFTANDVDRVKTLLDQLVIEKTRQQHIL